MSKKELSIIIPAYNAEAFIENTILEIIARMEKIQLDSYEISLIENGSTDRTKEIITEMKKEFNQINLISLLKADLGLAIKKGISESHGEFSIYLPADLSYGANFIDQALKYKEEYDVIFGSKKLRESEVEIKKSRKILSKFFSFFVKLLFHFKVKDTQGVKAFKTDLFIKYTEIFPNGFLWDIGFVFITKKKNYKWIEIPCKISDLHKSSTIKNVRTSIIMFVGLIKFRFKTLLMKKY